MALRSTWKYDDQLDINGDFKITWTEGDNTGGVCNLSNADDRTYHRQYGIPRIYPDKLLIKAPTNFTPLSGEFIVTMKWTDAEAAEILEYEAEFHEHCKTSHWYGKYSNGWVFDHANKTASMTLNVDPSKFDDWFDAYFSTYEFNVPVRVDIPVAAKMMCTFYQHNVFDWVKKARFVKAGDSVTINKKSNKSYIIIASGNFDLLKHKDIRLQTRDSVTLTALEDSLVVQLWL